MQKIRTGILLLYLLSSNIAYSQSEDAVAKDASVLLEYFKKNHYSPRNIDNSFCQLVFNNFISELDPKATLFLEKDYELLSSYILRQDDFLLKNSTEFLDKAVQIFSARLTETDSLIGFLASKPFDFSLRDTLFASDPERLVYRKDAEGMKKLWTRRLKYYALLYICDRLQKEEIKDANVWKKLEPEARAQSLRLARKSVRKWKAGADNPTLKVSGVYLNSLANAFDPHSAYFNTVEKDAFLSYLSTSAFSYGFYLKESDDGSIVVQEMTPGGPAWRSGELHNGDIVISIQKEGGPVVDFSSLDLEEAYKLIRPGNENYMEVSLISDGNISKNIKLKKEKLKVEENILQSYVLEGPYKAGYIALPDFFVQDGSNGKLGCANEVAKEVIKLKKENIDGLILDLRYNGGGSVKEAIDLAGLFINEGPMMLSVRRDQKPMLVKDLNRGTVYDGPLIVLINSYTASAAELLSFILKDYRRAVIMGSRSYGKATGQVVAPLDLSLDPHAYSPEQGNQNYHSFVKITTMIMYGIKGNTYQKKGITPDILLPDLNSYNIASESKYPNPIEPDSINKNLVYNPYPALPLAELQTLSKKRMDVSGPFTAIIRISDSLKNADKKKSAPLEWNSFTKWYQNNDRFEVLLDSLFEYRGSAYKVKNNQYSEELIKVDQLLNEILQTEISNIQYDLYINEAYNSLNDLIQITIKKQ